MTARFFVDGKLAAGLDLALPPAVARHVQVLRLQPGAPLRLFNGADGLDWSARVQRMGKSTVDVEVIASHAVAHELPWHVTLAFGAPANDRMDALVEKAGELGAAAIQPLLCERSVVRLAGERAEAKRRHWHGVAAAASEQCGRARVAEVLAMRPLPAWLDADPASLDGATRAVLSFDPAARPAAVFLADLADAHDVARAVVAAGTAEAPGRRRVIVLSGPEGGLSHGEEEAAVARGFVRVGLGPRVLRADTAPLAVLAWLGLQAAAASR